MRRSANSKTLGIANTPKACASLATEIPSSFRMTASKSEPSPTATASFSRPTLSSLCPPSSLTQDSPKPPVRCSTSATPSASPPIKKQTVINRKKRRDAGMSKARADIVFNRKPGQHAGRRARFLLKVVKVGKAKG